MAFSDWSSRLVTVGASNLELAAVQASYYASTSQVQQALDTLIATISNGELLVMLNSGREGPGSFQDGFPGGGLPFGTGVAVLTGRPIDDGFAIGAGTG